MLKQEGEKQKLKAGDGKRKRDFGNNKQKFQILRKTLLPAVNYGKVGLLTQLVLGPSLDTLAISKTPMDICGKLLGIQHGKLKSKRTMKDTVKVIFKPDCSNAPKKLLLRDFNVSVARGNFSVIGKNMTEDFIWYLYEPSGQGEIRGRENVLKEYKRNLVIKPVEYKSTPGVSGLHKTSKVKIKLPSKKHIARGFFEKLLPADYFPQV